MTTTADVNLVTRVKSITLTNFRGFKGTHTLDTDADLVLISGPNGYGKTSLLEALVLLLTGWHGTAKPMADLISRATAPQGGTKAGPPMASCSLSANVASSERVGGTVRLSWSDTYDDGKLLPMPEGLTCSGLYAQDTDDRELAARVCAFFQDRIPLLFDQAASGRTFRDLFDPIQPPVALVEERIKTLADEDVSKELSDPRYRDEWTGTVPEELDRALGEVWPPVAALLRDLRQELPDGPAEPAIPEHIVGDADLDRFARTLAVALGTPVGERRYDGLRKDFRQAIDSTLNSAIAQAKRAASTATEETALLQARLDQSENELAEIAKQFPTLDQDVARFAADDPASQADALAVFRGLAANANRWSQPIAGTDQRLSRVLSEFAAVIDSEAGKCAELLGAWLEERRRKKERRDKLIDEAGIIKSLLAASRSSEKLRRLESLQARLWSPLNLLDDAWRKKHDHTRHQARTAGRRQAREQLTTVHAAVKHCEDAITALTKASPELMEDLRQRAEQVLWRFSLVEGILPLRLDDVESRSGEVVRRSYDIRTGDGRLLQHLSTGQRAQVAISLLTAQNLAISDKLNHRLILLDDMTTAYDLSNLTREAILWRQLAYGATDPQNKRQIFISSHHEDLTNHLLDLLVPPPGGSMRMITLTGWSNERGPSFETFAVEPSAAVNHDVLGQALGAF